MSHIAHLLNYSLETHFIVSKNSALIREITKDDMVTAFLDYVDPSSSKRSKLSLHLLPHNIKAHPEKVDLGSDVIYIQDLKAFKAQLPVSDVPNPVEEFAKMLQEMSTQENN